jgi:hypothetical protein
MCTVIGSETEFSTLERPVLTCTCLHYRGLQAAPGRVWTTGLDVSTSQGAVLDLNMSTLHSMLHLNVSTPQGPE